MFKYLVSVPLRGFRSLIERRFCAFVIAGMAVSVPLRGFRSLIPRYFTRSRDNYFLCFRPLTGIPFLNKVNPGTGTAAFIVVSVPLRGFRSLIWEVIKMTLIELTGHEFPSPYGDSVP